MEGRKSNKGLVICLIILLLAFVCISILLGMGIVKSPFVKCDDCKDKTTVVTNDDKKADTKTVTSKTADERYKEYISNLASSIKENYVSDHEIDEASHESKDKYNRASLKGGEYNNGYVVAIKSNLDLVYNYMTTDDRVIAKDVVSFYVIHEGNGIYKTLYYITSDGKLHSVNLELHFFENEELKTKDLEYKNIVEVKQGSSTGGRAIFVDIDGNVTFGNIE